MFDDGKERFKKSKVLSVRNCMGAEGLGRRGATQDKHSIVIIYVYIIMV